MLSHEKQLDVLLDELRLTVHPLKEDNCWGIYASTPEKAIKRFLKIKKVFPKAKPIKLEGSCFGDFGVDLYGESI